MLMPTKPYFARKQAATMMLWSLVGIIAASKEVHHAIDTKKRAFRYDEWSGHVMAHVHHTCMKYDDSVSPRGSPFKPKRPQKFILNVMERCLPEAMQTDNGNADVSPDLFYRFNIDYWRRLFPSNDYSSVSVQLSVGDALQSVDSQSMDVVIIVQATLPEERPLHDAEAGHIVINDVKYQARVILCITLPSSGKRSRPAIFTAERFA